MELPKKEYYLRAFPSGEITKYYSVKVRISGYDESIYIPINELKSAEYIKEEGAEEYRQALNYVLKEAESNDRFRAFRTHSDIHNLPVSKLIKKAKNLRDAPKPGEIWTDADGVQVIIRNVTDSDVCYVWWSGSYLSVSIMEIGCFKNTYTKTA